MSEVGPIILRGVGYLGVMDSFEVIMSDIGTVPPVRRHRMCEIDVTLGRLSRARDTCLLTARAYGDHYAKVAWQKTFATMQKAGCGHLEALAIRFVLVVTAEEVVADHCQTQKAGNVFFQDFWATRERKAAMESLRAMLAQGKGKAVVDDQGTGKRGPPPRIRCDPGSLPVAKNLCF